MGGFSGSVLSLSSVGSSQCLQEIVAFKDWEGDSLVSGILPCLVNDNVCVFPLCLSRFSFVPFPWIRPTITTVF